MRHATQLHDRRYLRPTSRRIWRLGADGRYQLSLGGAEGMDRSEVIPGFWLRVAWLWQDPLPAVLQVLRELGLI